MNNYVVLDGKKYKTPSKNWQPVGTKPGTVRITLLGEVDATFGPASVDEWQGYIEGPLTPIDNSWGTVDELRASLRKTSEVTLIDHLGNSFSVVCLGPFKEESFMSMWDSPSNHFNISVRMIKVRQL